MNYYVLNPKILFRNSESIVKKKKTQYGSAHHEPLCIRDDSS